MRAYWDERARTNAAWYVDTSLDFTSPDMDAFFETGRAIAAEALGGSPVPMGRHLAVEIGSGLGRVCRALAEIFDAVIGVDVSEEMVARARQLVPDPRVTFICNDGTSLAAVDDAVADLVVSFTVFQHIPDVAIIEGYLREAGRVVRPGGVVVFQWNNEPGARRWRLRRAVLSVLDRTGLRRERYGRHHPSFLGSRVPLDVIERALADAGLSLVATRGLGTLYAWAWAVRPR